jgi:tetratricopeptide (TPR) repeat protein
MANAKKDFAALCQLIMTSHPAPAKVAETRKLLDEAATSFDRAVSLAGDHGDAYFWRGCSRSTIGFLRQALDIMEGKPGNPFLGFINAETASDLYQAARLRPRDYKALGAAVMFDVLAVTLRAEHPPQKPEEVVQLLPPQTQKTVCDAVARLEKWVQDPDPALAGGSSEMLGMIYLLALGDLEKATEKYRRVLVLKPDNEPVWDTLAGLLFAQHCFDELVTLSQQRLQHKPSAHSHFMLAKAYACREQWDQVEEEIRFARASDPSDFSVALADIAVRLRRAKDDASLQEIHQQLVKARQIVPSKLTPQQLYDGLALEAILRALTGDTASARTILDQVLTQDPSQEMARKAIAALNEP